MPVLTSAVPGDINRRQGYSSVGVTDDKTDENPMLMEDRPG